MTHLVTLTGHIMVPPDRLDDIRAALPDHIRATRAEPGCLSFDVVESTSIPGRFDVAERFTDAAAFRAHQTRAAGSDWGRISAGIPRDYVVTGLDD
ncbi:antibiotic biosynthesis monooxygenase [Seohaeicola saemankumensis]|nr:putative quinol monooxygenase [Seohaeicola saemankumensis]MCA0872120.1 antibiotic biosynthesis monooxygenase [Seohaeicola saemankumensis]